jgi:hypothetical protein
VTLKPGTVGSFAANSLAEAIESSFAAELRASKNQALPAIQVEDRRLLFAAIAQGVLTFLARNDADLIVNVSTGGGTTDRAVRVEAPTLSAGGGTVTGAGWPVGATVTLTMAASGAGLGSRTVDNSGGFSISVAAPSGGDVVGARDGQGHAAAVRVP